MEKNNLKILDTVIYSLVIILVVIVIGGALWTDYGKEIVNMWGINQ